MLVCAWHGGRGGTLLAAFTRGLVTAPGLDGLLQLRDSHLGDHLHAAARAAAVLHASGSTSMLNLLVARKSVSQPDLWRMISLTHS